MSAARSRDEWTTPSAPAKAPRESYAAHVRACPHCKVFAEPCVTGGVLRDEAAEFIANAQRRSLRDAKIARGERLAASDVDPPYPGCVVRRWA